MHESKSSHTRPLINNIFKCRLEELQKQDSARYRKDDDNLSAEAVESKAVNQDLTELTQKLDRLLVKNQTLTTVLYWFMAIVFLKLIISQGNL